MGAPSEYWKQRKGFILAAIGSAIGLGNIWRFSWLCYKDGGGAFLVPYFIALLIVGLPLIILEFLLGNYFAGSSPKVFRGIRKSLEIIGWMATLDVFIIGTYYAVVLAWVLDYIGLSALNAVAWFGSAGALFKWVVSTPWLVLIGLVITWVITWVTVFIGVSGGIERACLFAIPALWVLSAILVIRGVTLPGSDVGINWYLTPNWAALTKGQVWIDAFGQILFTLSIMAAPLIVYASYMPRKSELPNSAWITAFANCGFSFFFGFATWGILGYLMQASHAATPSKLPVPLGGGGLAFVTIPTAVTKLPGAPLTSAIFGTIFFVILWLAGYTSLLSIAEPVYAALRDKFGVTRKAAVAGITALSFVIGLAFVWKPGLIDPVDFMTGTTNLIWVVLLESVLASYYLGINKLREYANPYAELKLGRWLDALLMVITPASLGTILVYGLYSTKTISPISALVLVALLIASIVFAGSSWRKSASKVGGGGR